MELQRHRDRVPLQSCDQRWHLGGDEVLAELAVLASPSRVGRDMKLIPLVAEPAQAQGACHGAAGSRGERSDSRRATIAALVSR